MVFSFLCCLVSYFSHQLFVAGVCNLQDSSQTWWQEATSIEGNSVWEAHKPGCYPTEVPKEQAFCC